VLFVRDCMEKLQDIALTADLIKKPLSQAEKSYLLSYVKESAGTSCEYCGNGCGTSDCGSCCSASND